MKAKLVKESVEARWLSDPKEYHTQVLLWMDELMAEQDYELTEDELMDINVDEHRVNGIDPEEAANEVLGEIMDHRNRRAQGRVIGGMSNISPRPTGEKYKGHNPPASIMGGGPR